MNEKIKKAQDKIRLKMNTLIGRFMRSFGMRPASFPYLTGDGFRKIADHIYDESGKCRAEEIREGQAVFLKSDMIPEWFREIHPKIGCRYVLMSHNSDQNIEEQDLKLIDDKLISWYGQNAKAKHPKLTPLPIGTNNLYLNYAEKPKLYAKLKKIDAVRKNKIFFSFSIGTNPGERQLAYDFLKRSPIAESPQWIGDTETYLRTILGYKFIAAPDGNGNDDPRRWQAMYLGIVPIVRRTASMEYFKGLGLPIWIIDSWQELANLGEKELEKKYEEMKGGFQNKALFADYWIHKIKNK